MFSSPIVFFVIAFIIFPLIILAILWTLFSTTQRQTRLRNHGVRAQATIIKLNPIYVVSRYNSRQSLLVQVHPLEGTPFESTVITRKNYSQPFQVGMNITVFFDPQNPNDIIAERM